jgi:hypothetical protein
MPMLDQHPHVPLLGRGQPDPGKIPPRQQIQNVFRIPPVVLLLARLLGPNLSGFPHRQLVPQLRQHLGKPPRVARALDPYQGRLLQPGVKASGFAVFVLQPLLHHLACLRVQHRNLLEARMEITAYNDHRSAPPSVSSWLFAKTSLLSLARSRRPYAIRH